MIYDDLIAAHDQLNGPLENMSSLYQKVNDQISAAVAVDAAGAVNVDEAALRAALSEVVPPDSKGQYELLTNGLEMGIAVNPDGQRMLPWYALTNPDIVQHLDVGAWQALRIPAQGPPRSRSRRQSGGYHPGRCPCRRRSAGGWRHRSPLGRPDGPARHADAQGGALSRSESAGRGFRPGQYGHADDGGQRCGDRPPGAGHELSSCIDLDAQPGQHGQGGRPESAPRGGRGPPTR